MSECSYVNLNWLQHSLLKIPSNYCEGPGDFSCLLAPDLVCDRESFCIYLSDKCNKTSSTCGFFFSPCGGGLVKIWLLLCKKTRYQKPFPKTKICFPNQISTPLLCVCGGGGLSVHIETSRSNAKSHHSRIFLKTF